MRDLFSEEFVESLRTLSDMEYERFGSPYSTSTPREVTDSDK